jgi:hypothetical protein
MTADPSAPPATAKRAAAAKGQPPGGGRKSDAGPSGGPSGGGAHKQPFPRPSTTPGGFPNFFDALRGTTPPEVMARLREGGGAELPSRPPPLDARGRGAAAKATAMMHGQRRPTPVPAPPLLSTGGPSTGKLGRGGSAGKRLSKTPVDPSPPLGYGGAAAARVGGRLQHHQPPPLDDDRDDEAPPPSSQTRQHQHQQQQPALRETEEMRARIAELAASHRAAFEAAVGAGSREFKGALRDRVREPQRALLGDEDAEADKLGRLELPQGTAELLARAKAAATGADPRVAAEAEELSRAPEAFAAAARAAAAHALRHLERDVAKAARKAGIAVGGGGRGGGGGGGEGARKADKGATTTAQKKRAGGGEGGGGGGAAGADGRGGGGAAATAKKARF